MTFYVTDLQACEPDVLPRDVPGITVHVQPDLDSQGFPVVDVGGSSAEAVIEYVRKHWGEDDPEWFQTYVVDRVRVGLPHPPLHGLF